MSILRRTTQDAPYTAAMGGSGNGSGDVPLRVLLVDDQKIVLAALRAYVATADDIEVVGEASDGRAAVVQVRALRPDVVVMDLQMPGVDGIEATGSILEEFPGTAILAVTTFPTEEFAIPALRAGASGYLLKSEEPDVLLDGIRSVARGESVVSREITKLLVRALENSGPAHRADPEVTARADELTPREREVLAVLCHGRSNREISKSLSLSETTVKTHISSIMGKLGARDRVQVVVMAFSNDLLGRRKA